MATSKAKGALIFLGLTAAIVGGYFGIRHFINVRKKKNEEQPPVTDPGNSAGTTPAPSNTPAPSSTAPAPSTNTPAPVTTMPSATTPSGPPPLVNGQDIWVNKNSVILYTYPASDSKYMAHFKRLNPWFGYQEDGDVAQFNLSVQKLGKFIEPATAGWSKIRVAQPYGTTLAGDYYVPTKNIKTTPY